MRRDARTALERATRLADDVYDLVDALPIGGTTAVGGNPETAALFLMMGELRDELALLRAALDVKPGLSVTARRMLPPLSHEPAA